MLAARNHLALAAAALVDARTAVEGQAIDGVDRDSLLGDVAMLRGFLDEVVAAASRAHSAHAGAVLVRAEEGVGLRREPQRDPPLSVADIANVAKHLGVIAR